MCPLLRMLATPRLVPPPVVAVAAVSSVCLCADALCEVTAHTSSALGRMDNGRPSTSCSPPLHPRTQGVCAQHLHLWQRRRGGALTAKMDAQRADLAPPPTNGRGAVLPCTSTSDDDNCGSCVSSTLS